LSIALQRLEHEYALRADLDGDWAAQPSFSDAKSDSRWCWLIPAVSRSSACLAGR
jgi:hypothetical protein